MGELQQDGMFRALNERIRLLATTYRGFDDTAIPFVCECASTECFAPVVLSLVEYDEMCAAGERLLSTGHRPRVAVESRAR